MEIFIQEEKTGLIIQKYNIFPIFLKSAFGKEIAMTIFAIHILAILENEKIDFLLYSDIIGFLFHRTDEKRV
jgi:hypothetical protein